MIACIPVAFSNTMRRRKIIVDDSGDDEMLGAPSSSSVLLPAAPVAGPLPPAKCQKCGFVFSRRM